MPEEVLDPRNPELSPEDRLDKFITDVQRDADLMQDQSDKANEDMRFVNVTGGMWEGWMEDEFADRAKMEFDSITNPLMRLIAEWNGNRVGVEYRPDDSKTSDKDAEILNGIFRADFRDGSGRISVNNAAKEAMTCGYGAFKLATVFEDEEDPENDRQRVQWRPIYNAFNTVFWDHSAKREDKRDARWVTVLSQFTKDSFEEAFPGKDPVSAYQPNHRGELGYWATTATDIVYVATRYEIIRKREKVFVYANLATGEPEVYNEEDHELIKDELKDDENRDFLRERKILKQSVQKTVFSGSDILEGPKRISGKWLPVIPVYGFRAFVDGSEWYFGVVRKLKDAARLLNMHMNQLAENAASDGQEKPIFDPDQVPPEISSLWADLTNKPYLLAKVLRDDNGSIVQAGPVGYLKPGQVDQNTQLSLSTVVEFIREFTGAVPHEKMDPETSGKAVNALLKRQNLNTQPILDNIIQSIEWSGVVYQAMASEIYTRGQIVRTLGVDGEEGVVQLAQTVIDEKTGKVVEANNLRNKKFRAYADIGPQYGTMREETVENLKGIAEFMRNVPEAQTFMPLILGAMMENMEGVGLQPIKDFNRRNMVLMGLREPTTEEEKQALAEAQQQQGTDEQAELLRAAANQANAEAVEAQSRARNLDAKSVTSVADASKKQAETQKILSEIETDRAKTIAEIRKQAFESAKELPFAGV